jgi:phospholipid/cholesterol/gamma-HCH transport system substrate-binding protein
LDSHREEERGTEAGRDERGLTFGRAAAFGGVIALALLVALALFGGGNSYSVTASFENAGQLVKGNQVEVGGRPVGSISKIELGDSGEAEVTMKLEDEFRPLHQGTTATIRASSLSGIANRYVSLAPGPANAAEIDDGGRIGGDDTSAPVDLDQLFNTLDPETRRALQRVIQGSSDWYAGRAKEGKRSLKFLSPALSSTARLTREVALDERVFERFVTDTATVVSAVAERRDDLASLVSNANATTRAIADRNTDLERALQLLPGTLRKANTTFVNLRSTLDDLDVLVAESKPATRELAPFLRRLRPLVRDARPTIADLRDLIRKPGADNDLIELTAEQPRLAELTASVFPRTIRTLNRAQPVVTYAREYTPDLAGWFTKFGQGAANYDANGHFARIQPIFSPFSFTDNPAGGVLTPIDSSQRLAGFDINNLKRCPGGATQQHPDGSNNWPVESCDPGSTPPGP